MSDAGRAGNDPSMDDVLASIRKIIADDEARAQAGRPAAPADSVARAVDPQPAGRRDEVLLLTELVEEPKVEMTPDQSLVGAGSAVVATSAFERLDQAVQDSVPPPAAHDSGPFVGNGKTLEDIVKEMLRPMLKEWLDRNLPPMVERYVEREIVRLTRR